VVPGDVNLYAGWDMDGEVMCEFSVPDEHMTVERPQPELLGPGEPLETVVEDVELTLCGDLDYRIEPTALFNEVDYDPVDQDPLDYDPLDMEKLPGCLLGFLESPEGGNRDREHEPYSQDVDSRLRGNGRESGNSVPALPHLG